MLQKWLNIQLTCEDSGFVDKKARNPSSQEAKTAFMGTPNLVRSSRERMASTQPQLGHASRRVAIAWRILDALYREAIPVVHAEKM